MIVTLLSIAIFWFVLIIYLFYLLHKNIRDTKQFLMAFEYNDSSIKYNKSKIDPHFKELFHEFNRIIDAFRDFRLRNERELLFFKLAAQHAGVGLLAFSKTGEIKLINRSFIALFGLTKEKNINQFVGIDQTLLNFMQTVKPGKETLKLFMNNQHFQIATETVLFSYEKEEYKLIAFQDIKNEIDQSELEAWQKLIRILRHEIHNSLSPITVLSSGLMQQISSESNKLGVIPSNVLNNVLEGLGVIHKRSLSLSEFVENYKKLTNIPLPNFQPISVNRFLNNIVSFFKAECYDKNIRLYISPIPNESTLLIDEKLIEQAIINIIGNAIEAIQGIENGAIQVDFTVSGKAQIVSISDNGIGIPPDLIESIFIPFFTTKKNGSGIGLSLSRQIMRLHNGTLIVTSKPGVETIFSLRF